MERIEKTERFKHNLYNFGSLEELEKYLAHICSVYPDYKGYTDRIYKRAEKEYLEFGLLSALIEAECDISRLVNKPCLF